MSDWTKFRDSVVDALKVENVTETVKQDFTKWLLEVLMPLAESAAEKFITQIKAQAETETGWCKIRDLIVLPFVIQGGLWLIEQALQKTVDNTTTA